MENKTPTLEEVKEYFKNAVSVKSIWGIEFIGLNNIHFENNCYYCIDNAGHYRLLWCFDTKEWAKITSYKEEIETPKTDNIVESVVNQFKERSKRGIEKYGTTLQENNTDDFLQHFKEELMDAILYIQKLQSQRNDN